MPRRVGVAGSLPVAGSGEFRLAPVVVVVTTVVVVVVVPGTPAPL